MQQKKMIDRRWLPLNALRAFEGVAKHGSFTAAANALLISQSALSRHVIALERLTGVQLFERRPHALTLTKAGQHLLPAVVKSFDRLEYALDDIRNEGAPAQRTLRVQMPPSFAVQLAVPILQGLPPREHRGRHRPHQSLRGRAAAWGCGRRRGVLQARGHGSGHRSAVVGAPERFCVIRASPPAHRGKDLAAFIEANEIVHVRIADLPRHHAWSQFVRAGRHSRA